MDMQDDKPQRCMLCQRVYLPKEMASVIVCLKCVEKIFKCDLVKDKEGL